MIEIGLRHTSELTVGEATTALRIGSGDLPEGCTTVGGHISSSHLKPSKLGEKVTAVAEVTKADGKRIEFKVSAYAGETLLGEGTHTRFVVDRNRFMSKLGK